MPKHSRRKAGLPPGSVIYLGDRKVEKVVVHSLRYNIEAVEEKQLDNNEQLTIEEVTPERVLWYDFRGVHDIQLVEKVGQTFQIHPLVLEDITDTEQRPKFEEYSNGNFFIGRAIRYDPRHKEIRAEQVALFFGKGYVLSLQEEPEDLFVKVRERIVNGRGKIRMRGADYLAYALCDYLVDLYFLALEDLEKEIEALEAQILSRPKAEDRNTIHELRQEVMTLRKTIVPIREAVSLFSRADNEFITKSTKLFLRDLYDHTVQVVELTDTYRDLLHSLYDLYMSEINFRLNNVMQVLTIITTIFVPLSFLAGLYGMNFRYMPELEYRYGYFLLLGVMLLISLSLLYYFRRKGWL